MKHNDGVIRRGTSARRRTVAALFVVAALVAACSSDDSSSTSTSTTADPASITDASRQVDVAGLTVAAMPAGNGVPQRSATVPDARAPLPADYTESEYLVSGTAAEYTGPATGPATVASADHPFATRVLVRAPADPADFSGRVWLEPFNTSGGGELDAIWSSLAPLIIDEGDAWIGVTVRASQTQRLKDFDAGRYAGVALTNNDHGWDALRSVGTLVKLNPEASPLADYDVADLYMASAAAVDEVGNAKGGVRSPFVDVPLSRFEVHGEGTSCRSVGNETPLPRDVLVTRYGDATRYMAEFTESLDATIDAGFLLELDRQRILDAQAPKAAELLG